MTSIAATSLEEVRAAFTAAGLVPPSDLARIGTWGWHADSLRFCLSETDGAAMVQVGAVTRSATHGLVCRVYGGSIVDALVALRDELMTLNTLLPKQPASESMQ